MEWIHRFQLFLFDFDGLLVNTEAIHYQSYVNILAKRGVSLRLSLSDFYRLAHLNATAWRQALYEESPDLPEWDVLYREKKEEYKRVLSVAKPVLMPGAEALLKALEKAKIQRCVVTHSPLEHIQIIRSRIEVLQSIPHWITREDYEHPKPSPECYLKAIQMYGKKGDRIIGFEDSLRGFKALQQTPALAVLICPNHHPLLEIAAEGAMHFESLENMIIR